MPKISGLAAMSAPKCAGLAASRALLYCESWKESLSRGPLPNLIEDVGGLSLLKDCVTVHSEDVVCSN